MPLFQLVKVNKLSGSRIIVLGSFECSAVRKQRKSSLSTRMPEALRRAGGGGWQGVIPVLSEIRERRM